MKQKKQIIAPKSFTTQIIVSALDNRAIPEVVYLEIQNPDRGRKQKLLFRITCAFDLEIQNPDRGRKPVLTWACEACLQIFRNTEPR